MVSDLITPRVLEWCASGGLVVFVTVFVSVGVWALTRTRRDIGHWSRLAVDDAPVVKPPSADAR